MVRHHHINPCPPTTCRGAFTLIELLVVVTIIGLLIGILIPTIAGARKAGRAALCTSNLGQVMTAIDLYLKDNRDIYPSGQTTYTDDANNVKQVDLTCWNLFGRKGIGLVGNDTNLESQYRPLNTYLGDPERAQCPLDRGRSDLAVLLSGTDLTGQAAPNLFLAVGTSYAYAYRMPAPFDPTTVGRPDESDIRDGLLWMGGQHTGRRSRIEQPAEKLVVSDSLLDLNLPPYETDNQWHNEVVQADNPNDQEQLKLNAGFADGHVALITRKGDRDYPAGYANKTVPNLPIADVRELMQPGPSGRTVEYY
ncbi:MAG: prepilin-type N-terminal cleavage/methylation domain-containing protein [Phycisphaeraceae bacterium]|nr:prepilin-type N-terminal cleavage/methylation domain-containing protein [Phycisphaeraceae bacterium]